MDDFRTVRRVIQSVSSISESDGLVGRGTVEPTAGHGLGGHDQKVVGLAYALGDQQVEYGGVDLGTNRSADSASE